MLEKQGIKPWNTDREPSINILKGSKKKGSHHSTHLQMEPHILALEIL